MKRGTNYRIRVRDSEGRLHIDMSPHDLIMSVQAQARMAPAVIHKLSEFVVEVVEGEEVRERAGFEWYWGE